MENIHFFPFFADLMGLFEKRRFKKFLVWVQNFDVNDKSTYDGLDPNLHTMQQVLCYQLLQYITSHCQFHLSKAWSKLDGGTYQLIFFLGL